MQPDATADALTARQRRAVVALLSEAGPDAAAAAVGVNASTLWRWQKEPAFVAALQEARREAFADAATRLAGAAVGAAEALQEVAANPLLPPAARVSAARAILEHGRAAIETDDLLRRLDAIECRLDAAEVSNNGRKPPDR